MKYALLLLSLAQAPTGQGDETLIDLDVKRAEIGDIVRLFAEIGGLNVVLDPDVDCDVSVTLNAVPWRQALDVILRTCRLAEERIGENILRVARSEQIRREYEERRAYQEAKRNSGPLVTTYRKLAYARAKDVAPILTKFLSPRGSVVFDERTNTLIITDVAR